jgi:hypothetical protein
MGVKISDAPERVLAAITGDEAIPAGDGTNKLKILLSTIRSYVVALFTNKAAVLDNLDTYDSALRFNSLEVGLGFRKLLYNNKTSEFTVDIEAGTILQYMLCTSDLGTTPMVKIGTTTGGTEIAEAESIDPFYLFVVHKYFDTATTIYVGVESGRCDLMLGYFKSFNAYV